MKLTEGGICAPSGFKAAGIHCGIRRGKNKKDLALIVSEVRADAAAIYTTNKVKGAPILVTQRNIADGAAQAVICNSGNANTCNADGEAKAEAMCRLVERHTGIPASDVIVASTGVIGQTLDIEPIENSMDTLVGALGRDSNAAAEAIMTTDTYAKQLAVSFDCGGVECRIGGIAKGSGMICPNMATMLVFLTTDCSISSEALSKALSVAADDTFNMVTVDGDTSTNDTVAIMANGMAGNERITGGEGLSEFTKALTLLLAGLSKMIAGDGEGATKLLICEVTGAVDKAAARLAAKSVVGSPLVKVAMFGSDANWGRVICALGYSGAAFEPSETDVRFASSAGTVEVCRGGFGVEFSEEKAKEILQQKEITISVSLGKGQGSAVAYGCDLTYDYVRINGDYRT